MNRNTAQQQVTANEILSYRGDAEFGLAADGLMQTGVIKTPNSSSLLQKMVYLNLQKNQAIYQQKLADRDEVMKTVAEDISSLQQALPEDREKLLQQIKDIKQTYFLHGTDIKSKPEAWLELNEKLAKFREANVYAKSRFDTYTKGMAEAAKTTDPVKKKKILGHLEEQRKKDMYQPFDPYQQSLDFAWEKVAPAMETTESVKGIKGAYVTRNLKTDIKKSWDKYNTLYKHSDDKMIGHNVDTFLASFYGQDGMMPLEGVAKEVERINKNLKEIAVKEGYDPSDIEKLPDALKPLQTVVNDGQMQSMGYKNEDWFKIMLANQYVNRDSEVFDKNRADELNNQADIRAKNALANQRNEAAALNRAKRGAVNAKTKEYAEPKQFFDEVFKDKKTVRTTNGNVVTRINRADLSQGFLDAMGIEPINQQGEYNVVPTNIYVNGRFINESDFAEMHQRWYKNKRKELTQTNDKDKKTYLKYREGGWQDFMRFLEEEEQGKVSYEVEVQGKDADGKLVRTNALTTWNNQRAASKITGAKGVMEEDTSVEFEY